jgi:hypothetical protein
VAAPFVNTLRSSSTRVHSRSHALTHTPGRHSFPPTFKPHTRHHQIHGPTMPDAEDPPSDSTSNLDNLLVVSDLTSEEVLQREHARVEAAG